MSCADPKIALQHSASRRKAARETPFILHAQIANSAGTRLRLLPPDDKSRTLVTQAKAYHEQESLDAIAKVLESTGGVPSDAVILTLTLLTWQRGPWEPPTTSKYPVSPMATSQFINHFSNMEMSPSLLRNIQKLFHLLELRGGLDAFKLPGLMNTVTLYVPS